MKRSEQKMFIVRKYVMADSVESAIKKSAQVKVHDVYVDDDWRKAQRDNLAAAIGFHSMGTSE